MIIEILAVLGIVFSLYLLHIDYEVKKNKKFNAVCDISDTTSCTAVAKSEYSHIFGIPNALLGIGYYSLVLILSIKDQTMVVFLLSIPAIMMSGYLAYMSHFKIKKYCVVCVSTYVVNLLIIITGGVML